MLTDTAVRQAKPKEKNYILKDERGLYLEVSKNGSKRWRLRYWINKKENRLSLGLYPDITLKQARAHRDILRSQIANGIDPSSIRKEERQKKIIDSRTFKSVAHLWYDKAKMNWTKESAYIIERLLEVNVFPYLGNIPISSINVQDILKIINRMESRTIYATAKRTLSLCSRIFRYAVIQGWIESDPCRDLRGMTTSVKTKHMATIIDPKEIGDLLRAIDSLNASPVIKTALQLAPLVFVRPIELCSAEWKEINFDLQEWRIPAEKMKMRRQHIVPLSSQVLTILKEIKFISGNLDTDQYVFPQSYRRTRHISRGSLVAAIRRLGYTSEKFTVHGFRALASTRLNEMGYNRDWIERQLAHMPLNTVRASYNYAEYLPERKKMMQEWADYLDNLKNNR